MNREIGRKIKQLRLKQKKKLRDLSEDTDLSISYLSQIERDISSVTIYSLEKIARALGAPISYFLDPPTDHRSFITRNYEQKSIYLDKSSFYYNRLSNDCEGYVLETMLITVLPYRKESACSPQPHIGEEFIYVLEGILTVILDGVSYDLNPGDCMHYQATTPHDWQNHTGGIVRLLSVNTPRPWDHIEHENNRK